MDFIGTTVAHYRIDGHIGDGGMGNVYRAYDLNNEKTVALKVVHPEFANQPEFRARITQEAKTAEKLVHRGIVNILEFGEADGFLYLAMEYVGGGSLRQHLRRLQTMGKYLPFPQALQIAAQLAEALDYAHKHNAIHRDVKPSNVLLKRLEIPHVANELPFSTILTDFGLVKVLLDGDDLTKAGTTLGTPTYMSPEQCEGIKIDGRSDIYSLGVILYEMMTNRLPFEFKTLAEAVSVHRAGKMPKLARDHRADVPPIIDSILSRSLAKNPDHRFIDAAEMASALRRAMVVLSSESAVPTSTTAAEASANIVDDVEETNVIDAHATPPDGWELIVSTTGKPASSVTLGKSEIEIGRATSNDVILPVGGVSRKHANLLATEEGWAIMDLGGINGTYLDGKRLPANTPVKVPEDGTIRISAYNLTIQKILEQAQVVVEPKTIGTPPVPQPVVVKDTPKSAAVIEQVVEPETLNIVEEVIEEPKINDARSKADIIGQTIVPPSAPVQPAPAPRPPLQPSAPAIQPQSIQSGAVQKQDTKSILELVEPLTIKLPYPEISVVPGEIVSLPIEIFNHVGSDNMVTVRALGVPTDWLNTAQFNITVPARGKTRTAIEIRPPQRPEIAPGRQRIRIEVSSSTTPHSKPAANASVNIGVYESFAVRLEPDSIRLPKDVRVYVSNEGNSTATYSLMGYDQMNKLKFTGQRGRVVVEPGKTESVELGVEQKNRETFGDVIIQPFGIEVTTKSGLRQIANGEAETTATVPRKALYFIPPLLALCCLLGVGLFLLRGQFFNSPTGGLDSPAIFGDSDTTLPDSSGDDNDAGLDDITVLPTQEGADASAGDRDGDGLRDEPEGMLGTDPDLPDTDEDGLSDGDEVFEHGTKPTVYDTDEDGLSDGEEVNEYGTNPQSADTDSDGIDDLTEINQGTDPNAIDSQDGIEEEAIADENDIVAQLPPTATPQSDISVVPVAEETNENGFPTPAPPLEEPTEEEEESPVFGGGAVDAVVSCTDIAPIIDGTFNGAEWGNRPIAQFQLDSNPARIVNVYAQQDFNTIYLAAVIADTTSDPSDTLYVFFDSNGNGGDPDQNDRYYTLEREGRQIVSSGAGSNSDSDLWAAPLEDGAWYAEVGGLLGGQWLVEMEIYLEEFEEIGDSYRLSMQSFFVDEGTGFWPANATLESPDTWQVIPNPNCENTGS